MLGLSRGIYRCMEISAPAAWAGQAACFLQLAFLPWLVILHPRLQAQNVEHAVHVGVDIRSQCMQHRPHICGSLSGCKLLFALSPIFKRLRFTVAMLAWRG